MLGVKMHFKKLRHNVSLTVTNKDDILNMPTSVCSTFHMSGGGDNTVIRSKIRKLSFPDSAQVQKGTFKVESLILLMT